MKTHNHQGLGFIFVMFSAIFWGTNGTFCTLLYNFGFEPTIISILAPTFNLIFFSVMLFFTNKAGFKVSRKLFLLLLLGGVSSAIANTSFVKSLNYFPVGIVSTLIFCNIFVIMIISRLVFKSKITPSKVGAAIVSIFGVCLVLDVFSQGFHYNYQGLLWIILAILSWSIMMTLEKYLLVAGMDENAVLMYIALFAVMILSISTPPIKIASSIVQISSQTNGLALIAVLGFGLIPQIGCYALYIKGLKYIEPSYVQIFYSLDPVVACILGFIVFNQSLSPGNIAGICLIIGVVLYLQLTERAAIEPTLN